MENLSLILVQFIFRVTFGLSLSMAVTPSRLVTSGYYRIHLWVLMGLNTLASLAVFTAKGNFEKVLNSPSAATTVLTLAIVLAVLCYVGAVAWLYESSAWGQKILFVVALIGLAAAFLASPTKSMVSSFGSALWFLDVLTSGLLLGVILAAMFLGHWYLNTPTMELVPLNRLVTLMIFVIIARMVVAALGLGLEIGYGERKPLLIFGFVAMRWISGLIGTLVMAIMTRETLKIPNTQSATGILYTSVILVFIGELTSQLLSAGTLYPL